MGSTANPRRVRWQQGGTVLPPGRPYDIAIRNDDSSQDEPARQVRGRAARLSASDPEAFFAAIREAQRLEGAGVDPVSALECGLDSAMKESGAAQRLDDDRGTQVADS